MRILHLLSQTILTGAEAYAVDLCHELQKQGHQLWIASDTMHLPTSAEVFLTPVHDRRHWNESIPLLQKLIAEKNIQWIHSHSRSSAKLAQILCRKNPEISHVHTFHGLQKPSFSKRWINSFGEANIFVCENIQKSMIAQKVKFADLSWVVRNSLRPRPISENSNAGPAHKIKVALISRLSNLKGQRTLQVLQATLPVITSDPRYELHLLAGDFESLSTQDQQIIQSALKLHSRQFFFHGFASNLSEKITEYDLVIGGGRIAAEAMINRVPVMAFGESAFLGLIQSQNLQEGLASNFGDITVAPWSNSWLNEDFIRRLQHEFQKWNETLTLDSAVSEQVQKEFDFKENVQNIFQIYLAARGKKLNKYYFPILMYHKIITEKYSTPHKIYVLAKDFEKHLRFLKNRGFTSLHFKDYQKFRTGEHPLSQFPQRPCILTFDDGYLNNLEIALPLLEKYQMKATVFLLANNQIRTNQWDASEEEKEFLLMNPEQRKLFSEHPLIEIGSHGFSHLPLDQMSSEEQRKQELELSKKSLEQELKIPITTYAYTYGRRSTDASHLARQAGYNFAVNTDTGGLHIEQDPWSIFRISIFPNETWGTLFKKTYFIYRIYYRWKRMK